MDKVILLTQTIQLSCSSETQIKHFHSKKKLHGMVVMQENA